jgi:hypothetical protein
VVDAYAFRMLLDALLGWLDQRQQDTVAYLIEENRILRELIERALATSTAGPVRRRPRLGGLLNYYVRAA